MRLTTACLLVLLVLCPATAQKPKKDQGKPRPKVERKTDIWTDGDGMGGLKTGAKGYWYANGDPNVPYKTRVYEVIDGKSMLMQLGSKPPFLVKGEPTKGLADDEVHHLTGEWKCTGTAKVGGKTVHVVERTESAK